MLFRAERPRVRRPVPRLIPLSVSSEATEAAGDRHLPSRGSASAEPTEPMVRSREYPALALGFAPTVDAAEPRSLGALMVRRQACEGPPVGSYPRAATREISRRR